MRCHGRRDDYACDVSCLGRLTVVVVVEFVGYVPVLYGARSVGWTSLYATRTVVFFCHRCCIRDGLEGV